MSLIDGFFNIEKHQALAAMNHIGEKFMDKYKLYL